MNDQEREKLTAAFAANFAERGEIGAAVAVWEEGVEAIHLVGGTTTRGEGAAAWTPATLVPVWSTTKGPAAAAVLLALDRAGLDLATPVRHVWPAFPAAVNFGQALSHQAGLPALPTPADAFDHPAAVAALEQTLPAWPPGMAHGYHPRTFSTLLEEFARRLTSAATLGDYWREEIAAVWQLDIWIGLPESEHARVATVYPGKLQTRPEERAFATAFADPHSLTRRAFSSLRGANAITEFNQPAVWRQGWPGFGGVASAGGLAKFYGRLALGPEAGIFSPRVHDWMTAPLASGDDAVLHLPTAFSAGFQQDPAEAAGRKLRHHYGPSALAFGHPGAGGSLAWTDPDRRRGFAYVMNLIDPGVMPNSRALSLVAAFVPASHE